MAVGRITLVDGDTGRCPNNGGTGGSTGVTRGGTAVRQAAATARQALLRLGAERLKRRSPISRSWTARSGAATARRGIGIGRLVRGQRLMVAVDPTAPLAAPSTYTVVGTSPLRPDVPAKCTGRYTYIQDFSVPGMLHARVIRPPAIGARLTSVDESSVSSLPDVRVVRIDSFLAVVASDEWAAVRAASALKSTWTEPRELPGHDRLEPYLREPAWSIGIRPSSTAAASSRGPGRRREDADGHLFLALSEPRVARPVVRRRRRPRRRRHRLDVLAGDLRPSRHARARLRPAGRDDAGHLRGGVGLVRDQRRRPCGGRRAAAVEDARPPGPRAMVAAGRARLGSEGAAAAARSAAPASTPAAG